MSTAIAVGEYGGPEVLTLSRIATPEPEPGQVRIRGRATAVNPIDARIRAGMMQDVFPVVFPVVPGWDVAGVVDKVGEGATAAITARSGPHDFRATPIARPANHPKGT
ncbi:alcohol dehydrogenase catalytic domain-containing protein [Streptomyces caniferus]|uniref:alcohol dehydrogenase catalytic domain-containing protein n=1 Tax=Streptomyces caniferus TaxID=285557 RepID=UPI0034514E2D